LITDIPINWTTANYMYNLLKNATPSAQVVFGPKAYSTHIPGTTAYALKLSAVRAWAAANLK
jgi:hypothetical protein